MFIKKKKGYILLESLVILMFIFSISIYLNKLISNNYIKSSLFDTKFDIRTISLKEEEFLYKACESINNNKDLVNKIKEEKLLEDENENKIIYEYKNTGFKGRKIVITRNEDYIVEEKGNSKKYTYLEMKLKSNSHEDKIVLIPSLNKTDFIFG
ncbi:hypothetical protein JCM1393_27970 [Clostridium carnis]